MFGYIVINKPELRVREYEKYKSYYCGLCHALKSGHGIAGQVTLSYDMTFLVLLLTALYEPETTVREGRCIPHPMEKHTERFNQFSEYAADMNLLLTYYKLQDDWTDEKKVLRKAGAELLTGRVRKLEQKYPKKARIMRENLQKIRETEGKREASIDTAAGLFGEIMAELFVYGEDLWADTLREMGFYLGKFVYLMDAYDDREKDEKTGNYNVFLLQEKEPDAEELLTMMMASCARAYERLPIVEDADLLRNILYSGVWTRYCAITRGKEINGNESL